MGVLAQLPLLAEEDFPGKAVFEKLVGQWTSEGELIAANGDVIKVSETWVGKFVDEGKGFLIEGDRLWNGESQTFKWEYSFNATLQLLEVIYSSSDLDKELPMEVSVNEAEGSVLRRAQMGAEGAEIAIETKFEKGKLISQVTVTGADGQIALEGSFKHDRKNAD